MKCSVELFVIAIIVSSLIYTGCDRHVHAQGDTEKASSVSPSRNSGNDQGKNEEAFYYFNLGWRDDYYDNDDAFHKGYEAGGTLTIYVNDSPVSMYSRNGQIFRISPFLKPGKNSIRVSGKHSERIWLKVALANPEQLLKGLKTRKVVAKAWLEPGKDPVLLEFDARISASPEFDELGSDPKTQAVHEKELRQLVDRLLVDCTRHDADSFNQSLLPAISASPEYAKSRKELLESKERFAEMVSNSKYKLLTKRGDVKIVYGTRSVVLYSGDQKGSPYFLNFDTGEENSLAWMDAITLVRIRGRWTLVGERIDFPFSFGM